MVAVTLLLVVFTACGEPARPGVAPAKPAEAEAQDQAAQVDYPFVAFSRQRLGLGTIGESVEAPTVVGSTPSPLTMASSAPGVVEVTPDGRLRALANGRAVIRSLADPDQTLQVEVHAVGGLSILPKVVPLAPGEEVQLSLEAAGGRSILDPAIAEWSTTAPDVAVVIDGRLTAGSRPGRATVRARLGGQEAMATPAVSVSATRPASRSRGRCCSSGRACTTRG